jgi:two-component system response regulator AtoC
MSDQLAALLIGESAPMRDLRALVTRVARTMIPILIEGETGTGKELVAKGVHLMGNRRGLLVSVNACAIADTMFEDAMFGHVNGAYTGAVRAVQGFMVEANGGTLFLDEIASLPLGSQAKLLRAVETHEFRPVGASANRMSDFRVVAATNESLEALAEQGRFRWDLAHRLGGLRIYVPPLRDRIDDIPLLARHLMQQLPVDLRKRLTDGATEVLKEHDWPGNVRELRNVVESSAAISRGDSVDHLDIAAALATTTRSVWRITTRQHSPRDAVLLGHLRDTSWDVPETARRMGMHRATIYRQMRRLAVDRPGGRSAM